MQLRPSRKDIRQAVCGKSWSDSSRWRALPRGPQRVLRHRCASRNKRSTASPTRPWEDVGIAIDRVTRPKPWEDLANAIDKVHPPRPWPEPWANWAPGPPLGPGMPTTPTRGPDKIPGPVPRGEDFGVPPAHLKFVGGVMNWGIGELWWAAQHGDAPAASPAEWALAGAEYYRRTGITVGSGGPPPLSFARGTPNLDFMDFGKGTLAILHGREKVIPEDAVPDQHDARLDAIDRQLSALQAALLTMPGTMTRALRDALLGAVGR